MINPSLIYTVVTMLLALVDALRIKAKWGKAQNIDHDVSYVLAVFFGFASLVTWIQIAGMSHNWWVVLASVIAGIGMIGIRVVLYDPLLNFFRILTGTNPTGRIDYESPTTSSYVDNHSRPIGFWWKRVIGGAGWFAMYFLYKVIFKV